MLIIYESIKLLLYINNKNNMLDPCTNQHSSKIEIEEEKFIPNPIYTFITISNIETILCNDSIHRI